MNLFDIILFIIIGLIGNYFLKIEKIDKETAYKIDIPENQNESASNKTINNVDLESVNSLLINASFEKDHNVIELFV